MLLLHTGATVGTNFMNVHKAADAWRSVRVGGLGVGL